MAIKVGIQLYSVRNSMMVNPIDTINKVGKLGYRYFEVANHNATEDFGVGFNVDSSRMKEILSETGSRVVSAHIFPFLDENIDKVLSYFQDLGTEYIAISLAFFKDKDDVLKQCKKFEKIGKKCREYGISFLYHNHFHEFQEFEGQSVLDIIKDNTDPKYLSFELDTFWSFRAGKNPVEVMDKLGDRLKLIHQKDYSKTPKFPVNLLERNGNDICYDMDCFIKNVAPEDFTEIGLGQMDIQAIIDKANEIGVEYVILEQDFTELDEMESIGVSMESFKKYNGIEWN